MAVDTYYYFFSLIVAFGTILWTANLAYYKKKGKLLLTPKRQLTDLERERADKYSSNRNLMLAASLVVLFAINLIFDAYRLLHSHNNNARFVLLFAPAVIILTPIFMLIDRYNKSHR